MKVVFDENVFDEIDHFHPNFDESVPNHGPNQNANANCFYSRVSHTSCRQCLHPVVTLNIEHKVMNIMKVTPMHRCPCVAGDERHKIPGDPNWNHRSQDNCASEVECWNPTNVEFRLEERRSRASVMEEHMQLTSSEDSNKDCSPEDHGKRRHSGNDFDSTIQTSRTSQHSRGDEGLATFVRT